MHKHAVIKPTTRYRVAKRLIFPSGGRPCWRLRTQRHLTEGDSSATATDQDVGTTPDTRQSKARHIYVSEQVVCTFHTANSKSIYQCRPLCIELVSDTNGALFGEAKLEESAAMRF